MYIQDLYHGNPIQAFKLTLDTYANSKRQKLIPPFITFGFQDERSRVV